MAAQGRLIGACVGDRRVTGVYGEVGASSGGFEY